MEIVTSMHSKRITKLTDLGQEEKRSAEAESYEDFMKTLHNEVKINLEHSNQKYKCIADRTRRHRNFTVGDEVMIHLKKKRFFIGTYSKLKMKKFEPCRILRNSGTGNAFKVDLPNDMDISPIFNIFDLYECHKPNDDSIMKQYPRK